MAIDPEGFLLRKPKHDLVVGEDIFTLSVAEFGTRIAALEAEIGRGREAFHACTGTRHLPHAAFNRPHRRQRRTDFFLAL